MRGKVAPHPPSDSPKFRPRRKVAAKKWITSQEPSRVRVPASRLLCTPGADHGGFSLGPTNLSFRFNRIQPGALQPIWGLSMPHC